jgi:hypothetical protein
MSKIKIPTNADYYCTNYEELKFHVAIEDDVAFEKFCSDNNIGYHNNARKDVIKSVGHVFTSNKEVFENFPANVDII